MVLSRNMDAERTNPERHLTFAVFISGLAYVWPCLILRTSFCAPFGALRLSARLFRIVC